MKTDLVTSTIAAIVGVAIAFFVCNLLLPEQADVSFKTVNSSQNYSLASPNVDVFNFRALNPTVEVYVGDCTNYGANGECLDEEVVENTDESTNNTEESSSDNTTAEPEESENGSTN